ncbi:hypothetical protein N7470_009255 [Penicillium chermesinum]|nr:hypothetical protein N7470_009255 [Penicillium chermesinum]
MYTEHIFSVELRTELENSQKEKRNMTTPAVHTENKDTNPSTGQRQQSVCHRSVGPPLRLCAGLIAERYASRELAVTRKGDENKEGKAESKIESLRADDANNTDMMAVMWIIGEGRTW